MSSEPLVQLHLLDFPVPAAERWYRDELLRQLAGGQPVRWPESEHAEDLSSVG